MICSTVQGEHCGSNIVCAALAGRLERTSVSFRDEVDAVAVDRSEPPVAVESRPIFSEPLKAHVSQPTAMATEVAPYAAGTGEPLGAR